MLWRIRAALDRRLYPWLSLSARRELLDNALRILSPRMTGRVLEIGAGRGKRRGLFRPPTEAAEIWLFTDLAADRMPDFLSDVNLLPCRDQTFDTLLCLEVLEYLENPVVALREMGRVLRPGGVLILSMPFLHRWDAEQDYWRLTGPGLRFALGRAGFAVESLSTQGGPLAVIVNILRHLMAKHPKSRSWWMLCLLLQPFTNYLMRLDGVVTGRCATFATFTTGFVVVATRRQGVSGMDASGDEDPWPCPASNGGSEPVSRSPVPGRRRS
ncbi:MAG: class I SAM-dependent methyltransferase [Magnetococcales bacterium]|nr:class I SAM-dependent methyltransferase [Magnetococcales bacterium]